MTSQPQPAPGEGRTPEQYLRPLRDLATWALVGAPAVLLLVAIIRLIPAGDGEQFASRTQDSFYAFVNVATIFFPLAAVLLALVVRPRHPKAKLITAVAAVEYAVAAFFGVVFGILVALVQIGGFSVRAAFEELLVRAAWLVVFGLAAFGVYRIWRGLFHVPKPQPQSGVYGQPQHGVPGMYPDHPGYGTPPPGYGQPGQPAWNQPAYGQPGFPPPAPGPQGAPDPAWGPPPAPARPATTQPIGNQPISTQPISAQPAGAQPLGAQPPSASPVSAQPASNAPAMPSPSAFAPGQAPAYPPPGPAPAYQPGQAPAYPPGQAPARPPGQAPAYPPGTYGTAPAGQSPRGAQVDPTQVVPRHDPMTTDRPADRTEVVRDDRPGFGPADEDPHRH